MMNKKEYRNFKEQVDNNVKELFLFNDVIKFDVEVFAELTLKQYDHYISKSFKELSEDYLNYTVEELENMDEDEFGDLIHELACDMVDNVYQWYLVKPYNVHDIEELDRLNIIYSKELDNYVMPVFHYGTAWDYVPSMG